MSFHAMQAALRTPDLPPAEKVVLIALADHAGDDGCCWPSIPTLARAACLSERQTQRVLSALQARGLIHRQPRARTNGARSSDLYRLYLPGDDMAPGPVTPTSPQPVTPTSPGPVTSVSPANEPSIPNPPEGTPRRPERSEPPRRTPIAATPDGSPPDLPVPDPTLGEPMAVPAPTGPGRSGTASRRQPARGQAPRAAAAPRRSTRCPRDYAPSPSVLAFARAEGFTADALAHELARLRDHEFRSPRADWDATFRNWLRTALRRRPQGGAWRAVAAADAALRAHDAHPEDPHDFTPSLPWPQADGRRPHPRGVDIDAAAHAGNDAAPYRNAPDHNVPSHNVPAGAAPAGNAAARLGPAPARPDAPSDPRRASTDARRNAWIALAAELAGRPPG